MNTCEKGDLMPLMLSLDFLQLSAPHTIVNASFPAGHCSQSELDFVYDVTDSPRLVTVPLPAVLSMCGGQRCMEKK